MYRHFLAVVIFIAFTGSASVSLAQPVFTIQNKKDACNGQANGSFEILVTSATGSVSAFVFSSGPPIGPISLTVNVPYNVTGLSGTVAGRNYLVVVSDDTGTAQSSTTIFLLPGITASIASATNSTSCSSPNGAIDINASGGSGNLIYSWTATNGFTASTQDISGLSAGDYSVVITDAGTNCTASLGPITITEPTGPADATLNLTGANTVCFGQSTTLTVTINGGVSPYSVDIAGHGLITNYVSGTNITVSPAATVTYTLNSVADANGCLAPALNGSHMITVVMPPDAGTDNTVSACNNNSAFDLFASLGGTPDAGGTWTQLTGASRTITGNNVDLNGAAAGTYTFEYRVAGTAPCADATAVVTVNVVAAPNAGTDNTVSACNNNSAFDLFASLGGTPDAGGTWTQLTGSALTITGNNVDLTSATAGTYTFEYRVTATAPCVDAIAVITLNVDDKPDDTLPLSATIDPVCSGGSSAITVSNSESGVSYVLRNNADNSVIGTAVAGNGLAIDLPTGTLTATTTFNVLAVRGACAIPINSTVTITVLSAVDPALSATAQASAVCEGTGTSIDIANSQIGVNYQLRNDADDSPIGAAVAGTGGTISLPTGNLSATTTFNILGSNAACSAELSTLVTVNVDFSPDAAKTLTAAISPLCGGASTTITVSNSQAGVNYQLRNDADDSLIGSPVAGTGGNIALSTGALTATTTFNVIALNGSCPPVELNTTVTVAVGGTIDLTLAVTPNPATLCSGSSADVRITSSETGVDYQLIDDSDNSLIGGVVAGTGGDILLPTGNLTISKTFRVLGVSGSCSAELNNTASITVDAAPDLSLAVNADATNLCSGNSTFVHVDNSEPGIVYQLRDDTDNSNVSGAVIGNGATINLPTGPIAATRTFHVLATNGGCSAKLTTTITVTIDPAPIDLVPVAQNSSVCPGNGTFVQINNSEPGITYQLRDDSDNSAVSGAAIGNGGTINLATGAITGSRTFNVLATTPKCSLQLSTKVTITVLAANDPACSNCSTVTIQTINAIKVTCNVDVPDGSIEFEIIPPVPVINISGVKIDITGPTSKSQTDNFIFTGLAAGNYNYTVTYGDPANPACIKTGTFIIEAVRMPDPVTFDLTVTDFDCLTEFGTITLSNIQGAPNTEFKYVLNADGVTLRQGTITPAQAASPVTIGNILLGEYEIILNQDQQPENGCVGLVYSTPAAFNIEQPGVGCDIYIPNIFTPNGDGFNDTFVIKHLPPNAILKITNRWGKEVYSSDDYQNDWTGGDVSDGIYYYRLVVEGKSINGWVEILR